MVWSEVKWYHRSLDPVPLSDSATVVNRWTGTRWPTTQPQWQTSSRKNCTFSLSLDLRSFRSTYLFETLIDIYYLPSISFLGMECQEHLPGRRIHWGLFPRHCLFLMFSHLLWASRREEIVYCLSWYSVFSSEPQEEIVSCLFLMLLLLTTLIDLNSWSL